MNLLGRPIFEFEANWRDAIARQVTYDLRAETIGFGREYFTPTDTWTVNGWTFTITLTSAAELAALDAFTAGLQGRLLGFWLPIPVAAAQIVAGTSTTVFTVAAASLASFWADRPDTWWLFTFGDGSQAAAQLQSVVAGVSTETVTLTAALPQVPDQHTTVSKLHYVRLADDEETGEFFNEGCQTRKMSVLELPLEYAAAETGTQPIYLFHFWAEAPAQAHWFYTSFAASVVSQNQLYAAYPINFSGLEEHSDGSASDLRLEARPDPAHPFSLFLPTPFSGTLFCEIFSVDYTTPDVQTKLFSGRIVGVEDAGTKLIGTGENRLGYLKRKLMRYLKGQTCQNVLYDQGTCKAGRAWFETTISITEIHNDVFPPTVKGTFPMPEFTKPFQAANYLLNGQIEVGQGTNYETRSIIASSYAAGVLTLTLSLPLQRAAVGANAQIVAGCDHTATTCQNKFRNFANFNGFVAIPNRNPTLKAVNANPVSQGGK